MRQVRSHFVGGPRDGETYDTPGAHHHVFLAPPTEQSMTAEEAIALMATHHEDRPTLRVGRVFYTRRPVPVDGCFVYDYDRTEEP